MITVDLSDFVGEEIELLMTNNVGQVIYSQSIPEVIETEVKINLNQPQMKSGYYNVSANSSKQIIVKPLVISKDNQ